MANAVTTRGQQQVAAPAQNAGLPAWLVQAEQEAAAAGIGKVGASAPDMGGVRIPRLSVDGNVFSLVLGKDNVIQVGDGLGMTFVVVQAAPKYEPQRRYYDKAYDPNDPTPGNLICWSNDGKLPADTVTMKQSPLCQNCPVFKDCGGSWPALIWIVDENYVGPARWNMNFNTRRNAPVLPTMNKQYQTGNWYAFDQFLEVMARAANIGLGNIFLRAEFDRGKDVVKGKCIFSVVGTTDAQTAEEVASIEQDLFDAVFNPVITPRAEHEIDGTAQSPTQAAASVQTKGKQTLIQRKPAPAPVEEAEIMDAPAPRRAPAPEQAARRQAPAPALPEGTEDDLPQAQAPRPVQRQAPAAQAPRNPAPFARPQAAAAAPAPRQGVLNRAPAAQAQAPRQGVLNRGGARPPARAPVEDDAGSDSYE